MSGAPGPRVLVVIVNFNGGDWLVRAIGGLERQTFRDFRTVVVDNASSDGSLEAMLARFPSVEAIRSPTNLGFASANNLAVARNADSEWIALLNPDAEPEPGWLEALLAAASRHTDCGSFASRTLDAAFPSMLDGAGDAYHASGRYWRIGVGCPAAGSYLEGREVFSACAAAALYSRAAWDAVGGFDEDYFCYGEDVDLGFRMRLAGFACRYVPEAVALHAGSALTGKRSDFATYYGQRNLPWTFIKDMPGALFWLLVPLHITLNVAAVIALAMQGRGKVALRAKHDALRGVPTAWRKRRTVQRSRRAGLRSLVRSFLWARPFNRC